MPCRRRSYTANSLLIIIAFSVICLTVHLRIRTSNPTERQEDCIFSFQIQCELVFHLGFHRMGHQIAQSVTKHSGVWTLGTACRVTPPRFHRLLGMPTRYWITYLHWTMNTWNTTNNRRRSRRGSGCRSPFASRPTSGAGFQLKNLLKFAFSVWILRLFANKCSHKTPLQVPRQGFLSLHVGGETGEPVVAEQDKRRHHCPG